MDPYADLCMGCEKVGTLRCQPCKAAGQDIKFCSKRCQKIMWKSHKVYCGKGEKLFFQPVLLREEFRHFVELAVSGPIPLEILREASLVKSQWLELLGFCRDGSKASPPSSDQAWGFWTLHENHSKWQVEVLTSIIRCVTDPSLRPRHLNGKEVEGYILNPFTFIYNIPIHADVDESKAEEWIKINSNFLYSHVNFNTYTHSIQNRLLDNSDRKTSLNLWDRVCYEFEKVKKVSDPGKVMLNHMKRWEPIMIAFRKGYIKMSNLST